MSDTLLWVGLAFGIVAVVLFLEVILRNLINRVGTTQDAYPPQVR
jgi:hypothetical protein